MIIKREAELIIKELASVYPIVALTGPRQSGKTTLVQELFKDKKYVSLEDLDTFEFAKLDPRAFLAQSSTGLIIDEIQKLPELFSYLQGVVDKNKKAAEFIITGSQQLGLIAGISQTLAGRVGLVELLPFSIKEIGKNCYDLNNTMFKGFYPPLYDRPFRPQIWYEDYVKTYVERDVRNILNIKDLSLFQKFIALCAARAGNLINFSELSIATGVDVKTIKTWISVLEASYIIFLLKPHHKNFSKKLIKTPKLYFYDTGLLCYLLRIKEEELLLSPHRGHIFETMIISEAIKHSKNFRTGQDFYFWRDNKGVEVDLIFEVAGKINAVEIKSSATINSNFFDNLDHYSNYASSELDQRYLVFGGDENQIRSKCKVVSWRLFDTIFLAPPGCDAMRLRGE